MLLSQELIHAVDANPAVLEVVLQRVVTNAAAPPEELDSIEELLDIDARNQTITEAAQSLLEELDALVVDSRLAAFETCVGDLLTAGPSWRRVCVLTDSATTLYYLAADVEDHGVSYALLQGELASADRDRVLTVFAEVGGLLLATVTGLGDGDGLSRVTALILYDSDVSAARFQDILGHFEAVGRVQRLDVHVLVQSD